MVLTLLVSPIILRSPPDPLSKVIGGNENTSINNQKPKPIGSIKCFKVTNSLTTKQMKTRNLILLSLITLICVFSLIPLPTVKADTSLTLPYTIGASGNYVVNSDYTINGASALMVQANNVVVDFQGHSVTGNRSSALIFIGWGSTNVIIKNAVAINGTYGFLASAQSNFTLQNITCFNNSVEGIDVSSCHDFTVKDSTVYNNGNENFAAWSSYNYEIINCTAYNYGSNYGFKTTGHDFNITNCTFSGAVYSCVLQAASNAALSGCTFKDGTNGLDLDLGTNNVIVIGNTFRNNTVGYLSYDSYNFTVLSNIFSDNSYGISFNNCSYFLINLNSFSGSTYENIALTNCSNYSIDPVSPTPTSSPIKTSNQIISAAQVLAGFLIVVALLTGFAAMRRFGDENSSSSSSDDSLFGSGNLLSYIIAIVFLLLFAAFLGGMGA